MKTFFLKDSKGNILGEAEFGLGIVVKYILYKDSNKTVHTSDIFSIRKKYRMVECVI